MIEQLSSTSQPIPSAAPTGPSTTINATSTTSPQEANSTLDSYGRPAKKRSLIDVGKGSSQPGKDVKSNQQRRNSKRSLPGRKRKGSIASSHGSRRGQGSAAVGANSTLPAPVKQSGAEKPKKSGMSKFLAILNCCKAPTDTHTQPVDSPAASRKIDRPSQSTQSTPPQNRDTALNEKDLPDEKRPQPEPSAANTTFPKSSVTTNERKVPAGARTGDIADKATSNVPSEVLVQPGERSNMDKPLPASPKSDDTSKDTVGGNTVGVVGTAALAGVGAAGATKLSNHQSEKPIPQEPNVSLEEQVINDRTPEQARKDEDIEMKDVPPSVPIASNEVPTSKEAPPASNPPASDSTQTTVPPPPPAPIPPVEGSNQQLTVKTDEVQPEPQAQQGDRKWLLPAIRPELKGRKCLVLDLDETLVHSSFKVIRPTLSREI